MESTIDVRELVKEIQELKLKVTSLEEGLKNAETYISNIKNNTNSDSVNYKPVNTKELPSGSNNDDNDNNSISISIISDESPEQTTNEKRIIPSKPLIVFDENPAKENNTANENNTTNENSNDEENNNDKESMISKKSTENLINESWIGKNFMGAAASILILIALVIFAKLLLPYLTDTMKIILMFFASFTLTGVGFFFNRKKPENTFYKALLGCGSACIYLTILVTSIYFKKISYMVMYVLIALWAVLIIFLKKDKNDWLFFVIGNLGYMISLLFVVLLDNNKSLKNPVFIYVIMLSVIYQVMYWKNIIMRYTQSFINITSLLLFEVFMVSLFKLLNEVIFIEIVTIGFAFIGFMYYIVIDLFKYREVNFFIALTNIMVYLIAYFFPNMIILRINLPAILSFIVVIIPAMVLEILAIYWKIKNHSDPSEDKSVKYKITSFNTANADIIFSTILFYIAAYILFIKNNFFFYSGIIMVIYSLIVVYGIVKKDKMFKIQGWILVSLLMFTGITTISDLAFTIVATILTLSSLIVEGIILNNSEAYKICNYLLLLVWILRIEVHVCKRNMSIDEINIVILFYGIEAFINMAMILVKFYKTKCKEENHIVIKQQSIHIVLDILNLIFILLGVIFILALKSEQRDTLMIIVLIIVYILSCINLPIKDKGEKTRYLYTGIKFSFLLCFTLWIFETPRFVMSIAMIAYAVVCVALGFKNRPIGKSLRIFGLVMTLFFVVKFILIDINYNSSMTKALSYFISGILCFGISAIYNYFEKKQGSKQK